MGILRLAALSAIGFAGYKYLTEKRNEPAAFDKDQPERVDGAVPPVRDAGAQAMRDKPATWTKTDERSDESFPASDPAATY